MQLYSCRATNISHIWRSLIWSRERDILTIVWSSEAAFQNAPGAEGTHEIPNKVRFRMSSRLLLTKFAISSEEITRSYGWRNHLFWLITDSWAFWLAGHWSLSSPRFIQWNVTLEPTRNTLKHVVKSVGAVKILEINHKMWARVSKSIRHTGAWLGHGRASC